MERLRTELQRVRAILARIVEAFELRQWTLLAKAIGEARKILKAKDPTDDSTPSPPTSGRRPGRGD